MKKLLTTIVILSGIIFCSIVPPTGTANAVLYTDTYIYNAVFDSLNQSIVLRPVAGLTPTPGRGTTKLTTNAILNQLFDPVNKALRIGVMGGITPGGDTVQFAWFSDTANYARMANAIKLQGRTISSAVPTPGQVLGWNGSQWIPMTSVYYADTSGFAWYADTANGANNLWTAGTEHYILQYEKVGGIFRWLARPFFPDSARRAFYADTSGSAKNQFVIYNNNVPMDSAWWKMTSDSSIIDANLPIRLGHNSVKIGTDGKVTIEKLSIDSLFSLDGSIFKIDSAKYADTSTFAWKSDTANGAIELLTTGSEHYILQRKKVGGILHWIAQPFFPDSSKQAFLADTARSTQAIWDIPMVSGAPNDGDIWQYNLATNQWEYNALPPVIIGDTIAVKCIYMLNDDDTDTSYWFTSLSGETHIAKEYYGPVVLQWNLGVTEDRVSWNSGFAEDGSHSTAFNQGYASGHGAVAWGGRYIEETFRDSWATDSFATAIGGARVVAPYGVGMGLVNIGGSHVGSVAISSSPNAYSTDSANQVKFCSDDNITLESPNVYFVYEDYYRDTLRVNFWDDGDGHTDSLIVASTLPMRISNSFVDRADTSRFAWLADSLGGIYWTGFLRSDISDTAATPLYLREGSYVLGNIAGWYPGSVEQPVGMGLFSRVWPDSMVFATKNDGVRAISYRGLTSRDRFARDTIADFPLGLKAPFMYGDLYGTANRADTLTGPFWVQRIYGNGASLTLTDENLTVGYAAEIGSFGVDARGAGTNPNVVWLKYDTGDEDWGVIPYRKEEGSYKLQPSYFVIDSTRASKLVITDASGADSSWWYDDGDTVRINGENPIKVGNNSVVVTTNGTVKINGSTFYPSGDSAHVPNLTVTQVYNTAGGTFVADTSKYARKTDTLGGRAAGEFLTNVNDTFGFLRGDSAKVLTRLIVGEGTPDATNPECLLVNAGTTTSVNAIKAKGSINNYFQFNIQNKSNGNTASSDIVATADNGSETTNYVDLGINSSGYNQAEYGMSGADDSYLYSVGGKLTVGTATQGKSIQLHAGGTTKAHIVVNVDSSHFSIGKRVKHVEQVPFTRSVYDANIILGVPNNSYSDSMYAFYRNASASVGWVWTQIQPFPYVPIDTVRHLFAGCRDSIFKISYNAHWGNTGVYDSMYVFVLRKRNGTFLDTFLVKKLGWYSATQPVDTFGSRWWGMTDLKDTLQVIDPRTDDFLIRFKLWNTSGNASYVRLLDRIVWQWDWKAH